MQRIVISAFLALSAGLAAAAPQDFELQIGTSELDPSIWEGPEFQVRNFQPSHFVPSVIALYEEAKIDGAGLNEFEGSITPSGPTRISLYEVYRGSPEGIAYADYHQQYRIDANWEAIAQDYRDEAGGV